LGVLNNGFHNRLFESMTTPFFSSFCPFGNHLLRMVQDLR
jgi:hypothetical protein